MNEEVLRVAKKAREDFELGAIPEDLLITLYQAYHHLDDPGQFISEAKRIFPKLSCGVATVYLKHRLGKGKIIRGSYDRESHTFLMIENVVIDITADQYGGPKIYVGPLQKPWSAFP
jgi:hypothetical protein